MVKDFEHKDYWALVLGGSSGLGLASAQKLAQHGMNICVVHRNRKSELEKIEKGFEKIIAEGVDFISFNLDALNLEKRTTIISNLKDRLGEKGKVRSLIHSIAKGNLKPMNSNEVPVLKSDDFLLTIEAMAVSLYDWAKLLFENKMFAEDARILSFTSEGNSKAWRNYAAVSAAKASLEAITRNLALEFAKFGIRANCIQAGVTNTTSFKMIPGSNEIEDYTKMRNPFKRLTTPKDVADVVYLLCKDEAAWINGSVIPVNGGEHIV